MTSPRIPAQLPTDRLVEQATLTEHASDTTTPPTPPAPAKKLYELSLLVHGTPLRVLCR